MLKRSVSLLSLTTLLALTVAWAEGDAGLDLSKRATELREKKADVPAPQSLQRTELEKVKPEVTPARKRTLLAHPVRSPTIRQMPVERPVAEEVGGEPARAKVTEAVIHLEVPIVISTSQTSRFSTAPVLRASEEAYTEIMEMGEVSLQDINRYVFRKNRPATGGLPASPAGGGTLPDASD